MFLQNKYSSWYYSIISKAKSQVRSKKDGQYYESHHIIPKSLGGNNSKQNLVLLTAREHYICHLLLPKMCSDSKNIKNMCFALHSFKMKNKHHQRYNSKLYDYFRKTYSCHISGEKNPNYGNKWTDEQKKNLSITRKNKFKNGYVSTTLGLKRNDLSERNKLPKMWINDGQIDKQILKSHIQNYDFNIWKKGRINSGNIKQPPNIYKRKNGEIIILPEWLKKDTYQSRIRKGWKHEDAISIPLLSN